MKLGVWTILAVLLAVSAASPSSAASQIEPLFDNEPVVLPGIDVAAFGGPPWWSVSNGASTVYILASPVAPVERWDTRFLEQRLTGANRLILQPDMEAGIAVAMPQLRAISGVILRGKVTRLEVPPIPQVNRTTGETLSLTWDPLIETFRRDRRKAGMPEVRYGGLPLSLAAFALAGDVYEKIPSPDLPGTPVEETAANIAQRLNVPVSPAISYGGKEWAGFLNQIRAPDQSCISATLKDLEQAPSRYSPAGPDQVKIITEGWARGDVAPLIAAFRDQSSRSGGISLHLVDKEGTAILAVRSPVCLRQIPLFRQISERWLTDETDAIVEALKTPGKTVVIYRATDLLFVGGVIDQLTKRGFTVKPPAMRDE